MELRETEAIVCRHMDYKESSRLVFCYTPSGRQSFLAQGANKLTSPLRSATETLTKAKITSTGKGMQIIKDIEVLDDYTAAKQEIERYATCLHILELTLYIADSEIDHEKLYRFLVKILNKCQTETNYLVYLIIFESKLLHLIGLQPHFSKCLACGATADLVFSVKEGGMCCKDHLASGKTYPEKLISKWKFLHYYDLAENLRIDLDAADLKALILLLDEYYEYHLSLATNSRKLLKGLLGY